jgi:hypothetical protein
MCSWDDASSSWLLSICEVDELSLDEYPILRVDRRVQKSTATNVPYRLLETLPWGLVAPAPFVSRRVCRMLGGIGVVLGGERKEVR